MNKTLNKITFLGSGSAWVRSQENYQSNILIQSTEYIKDKEVKSTLLYDAGSTLSESLLNLGLSELDIDSVFISHLHNDHSGGVEDLAFKNYFMHNKRKINLLGSKEFLNRAWNTSWNGGLKYINEEEMRLNDYFNVLDINNNSFNINSLEIKPTRVHYVKPEDNFGLFIKGSNKKVFITGDSTFQPNNIAKEYSKADIIFQDCDFNNYPNGVHAQFHELQTLSSSIKKKMFLYHYSLGDKHIWYYEKLVHKNGFAGIVRRGEEFIF